MSRFHPSLLWKTEQSDQKQNGKPESCAGGDSGSGSRSDNDLVPEDSHSSSWHRVGESTAEYSLDHSDLRHSDFDEPSVQPSQGNIFGGFGVAPTPTTFFVPLHYEPKYRYPLIVWLHSDGFNENQVNQIMPHISGRNYLATGVRATRSMDAVGHQFQWHSGSTAIEQACFRVEQAIDEAQDRFSVHPDRIVLAGYESGATMALRIAMRIPNLVSAAISMGGRMPYGAGTHANLHELRARRLPMLWQCALEHADFSEKDLNSDLRSALMIRSRVEVRGYKDDDVMNTAALSDINHWIMNHVVNGAPFGQDNRWETSPVGFSDN